ncbi:putative alpha,alpha-trehalose-phosphate synthase 9-like isoform X1 [Hibiscus syriacus]|uniref:Alpha,alpha-trehalose-phosphate synthase 9-like isoform X1 n=1 Tax=Hibiscus syriacus TaxID=106335 RepID=A0A6A3B9I2_HIBSY|nr:putative alpha,alpha-trehalose-phosphate synthase 9-like isoform X1 [Hibiscus syriacus]
MKDQESVKVDAAVSSPYQQPLKPVRPPLIPTEDDQEKQEEGFFGSMGKLFVNGGVSALEILKGVFPGFRKESVSYQYQIQHQQQLKQTMPWPAQESFVIPDEDEPPSIDTRATTPRKTYPFMSKDADKIHQLRQSRAFYNGWDVDTQQQHQKPQHHHHRHQSSAPLTYYQQSDEKTNEIIFGAVQDKYGKQQAVVARPIDCDHHNFRFRSNLGYNYGH